MSEPPRVFVSHASEDKERFVLSFATALRSNGVNAWVDKWEIRPGDRLVRKLFEEGLKDVAAFIAVISKYSIDKPWVKEELDRAIVDRIEKETKIIPVLIDDCEVPEALKSTVWERVKDLKHFEPALVRVLDAVFDRRTKPPLGKAPAYFSETAIDDLTSADTVVFKAIYDSAVATNRPLVQPEHLLDQLSSGGISKEILTESLLVLEHHYYVEAKKALGTAFGGIAFVRTTHLGFLTYARAFIPEYEQWYDNVVLRIINDGLKNNHDLAQASAIPQFVVDAILEDLSGSNQLMLSKSISGYRHIARVSPLLKRRFST